MQTQVTKLLLSGRKVTKSTPRDQDPNAVFEAFLDRLRRVRVLDPACGSGNFLIVSLWALKDLEFEAIHWGSLVLQRPMQVPQIGPEAVLGIEINPYAAELARVTIWIGEIQWMIRHGLGYRRDPILRRLDHIETRDALLDLSDPMKPREADWPAAEFIVGNPPFLGNRLLRRGLGTEYTETVWSIFDDRVPHSSDFVCYWHEKARAAILTGRARRAGLLATQGIRGQANRRVLERINKSGAIFFARSDEPWVLAGAAVHISFVGQDDGSESDRTLDGRPVDSINADLTSGVDLTAAQRLSENRGVAYYADVKAGPFDIDAALASALLASPNPDGRPNAEVVRPWANALDVTRRPRNRWIIDFGVDMSVTEAALYEQPFEYVRRTVRPIRMTTRRDSYRRHWWRHAEPIPGMRLAVAGLARYIVTPAVAKHRLFAWLDGRVLADHALVVFARDDDYTFGVLHSRSHSVWSRAVGTQLESRPRYTPTTCFETFPFPQPADDQVERVGEAARNLVRLREGWLNPPGFSPTDLEIRTLTKLYNERPAWLQDAHAALDTAVFTAYGWPLDLDDAAILERLLGLNRERAATQAAMRIRVASK
jgi:type II restriction/modification system DNA methylase subunit YeeA